MAATPRKTCLHIVSNNATISSPRKMPRLGQPNDAVIVPRKSPARRRLFATEEDMDTGEGDLFVQRLLDEFAEEQKTKWGFDFERGTPLPNSNFVYERVSAENVPGFYRCFSMGAGMTDGNGGNPTTIPSDWVYPGAIQAGNECESGAGENVENINPLLRLEEVEESFANDTTSSSSVSFASAHSRDNKELSCVESSTSVVKENEELASSLSKRIFKTPTTRKPSRISDALPNRKHLQRSAKKLDLKSPKSAQKSSATIVKGSPASKRSLTVGGRLAAAGRYRDVKHES